MRTNSRLTPRIVVPSAAWSTASDSSRAATGLGSGMWGGGQVRVSAPKNELALSIEPGVHFRIKIPCLFNRNQAPRSDPGGQSRNPSESEPISWSPGDGVLSPRELCRALGEIGVPCDPQSARSLVGEHGGGEAVLGSWVGAQRPLQVFLVS